MKKEIVQKLSVMQGSKVGDRLSAGTSEQVGAVMMRSTLFTATLTLLAGSAFAQSPHLTNGRLTNQPAGASLDATFRTLVAAQAEPGWIGYAVPVIAGDRSMCCGGDGSWMSDGIVFNKGRWSGCGLEDRTATGSSAQTQAAPATPPAPVHLEGPEQLMVLYRVEEKAVQKIRIFSPECELDAGGRTLQWLDGVKGSDSVALLATFVAHDEVKRDRLTDAAVGAIAMHRDQSADAALDRFAEPTPAGIPAEEGRLLARQRPRASRLRRRPANGQERSQR